MGSDFFFIAIIPFPCLFFSYFTLDLSLFHRGYNIGVRLIEDFLARCNISRCQDFRETADVIAKVMVCLKIKGG